jgi:hypothetical protein
VWFTLVNGRWNVLTNDGFAPFPDDVSCWNIGHPLEVAFRGGPQPLFVVEMFARWLTIFAEENC